MSNKDCVVKASTTACSWQHTFFNCRHVVVKADRRHLYVSAHIKIFVAYTCKHARFLMRASAQASKAACRTQVAALSIRATASMAVALQLIGSFAGCCSRRALLPALLPRMHASIGSPCTVQQQQHTYRGQQQPDNRARVCIGHTTNRGCRQALNSSSRASNIQAPPTSTSQTLQCHDYEDKGRELYVGVCLQQRGHLPGFLVYWPTTRLCSVLLLCA